MRESSIVSSVGSHESSTRSAGFAPVFSSFHLSTSSPRQKIDVNPETPGLDTMLARFDKEHTHSEDEVRFILAGRGIFFLHLEDKVVSVEVHPGDMLRVPRGTTHWFTLCADRRIRATPEIGRAHV